MKQDKINKIFKCYNGYASSNIKDLQENPGVDLIPYKRPSNSILNTIAGYVDKKSIPSHHIFENAIMVSTDGEGSHTYSYFIKYKFVPNSNVMVLVPINKMTDLEMLIYSKIITMNRYRFQYGRKPKGKRFTEILIPEYEYVKEISLKIQENAKINNLLELIEKY